MPQAPGFLQFSPCPGCRMQSLAWVLPFPAWVRQLEFTQEPFVCCPDGLTCLGTSPSAHFSPHDFPFPWGLSHWRCWRKARVSRHSGVMSAMAHTLHGLGSVRFFMFMIVQIAMRLTQWMLRCIPMPHRAILQVNLHHFQLPDFDAHNKTSFILSPIAVNLWTTVTLS